MISIQQYRAAIGSFHGGKSNHVTLADNDDNPPVTKHDADPPGITRKKIVRLITLSLVILNVSLLGMKTYELVTEENSPLSLDLIRTLLTIGGVELNPGPTINEQRLMAELVLGAEDESSKNILLKIKSMNDLNTNRKTLSTCKVDELKTLAKYILAWDASELDNMAKTFTKEGLVTMILNRLKNLMPEDCKSCGIMTYFLPSDYTKSGLNCIKCDPRMCRNSLSDKSYWMSSSSLI